ncbi:MAG: Gfo/Idh/MocA family oxidoreductase [Candidatus Hydrogenedentes bacterium]|nr:Gfo/Idh/MocA family oxidoreductase [Candidatus Hydrogenedentota bacterium]
MAKQITRRSFLRSGAAAGAALALAAKPVFAAKHLKPVRVGVVGVGARGTFHVKTLLTIPGVEIRAIGDIIEEHAAQSQDLVEKATGKRPKAYTQGERDFENLCKRDDLDAVLTATPWEWHTPVMLAAMRAGKYGATEVPAAITMDECWELVKTSEQTGMPCMMLENVCYFQNALTILRMVREGAFGDLVHCEAGYQHDVRFTKINDKGELLWRGQHSLVKNGNQYPTHPIGPVAQWMNINRGDRFTYLVSMSTKGGGIRNFAAQKLGPDHPLAKQDYAQGDINTTLIKTANGLTVTLYHDTNTPRPYDLIFRVQGTKGIYMGTLDKLFIEGVSPEHEQWEPFAPYMEKYAHPLWKDLAKEAAANGGHGGGDYITDYEFVKAVRNRTQTPQDVYDAATWSVIVPLSIESVTKGSAPVEFPDYTAGKWKTNPPLPVYGA